MLISINFQVEIVRGSRLQRIYFLVPKAEGWMSDRILATHVELKRDMFGLEILSGQQRDISIVDGEETHITCWCVEFFPFAQRKQVEVDCIF